MNYPVKYAILGMEEQVGWNPSGNELERVFDVSGYIVSKVYLVEERKRYLSNGSSEIIYQVVFPYPTLSDDRQYPKYNSNFECFNSVSIMQIFDSFEDAKRVTNKMNKQLRARCYLSVSVSDPDWKERVIKIQSEFDARLQSYLDFEQRIFLQTEDMIISSKGQSQERKRILPNQADDI